MKKLLIAAVLACAPGAVFAADLSGAWNVNGSFDSMGVKYSSACKWTQDAHGALGGTCKGTANEDAAATGTVTTGADGKTVIAFAYDTTYQGTPVHLDYKGAVQGDGTIAGSVDAGGAQGTFIAAAVKP